jgi:Holliday junction resolvase RusA-like endonuclease
MHLTISGPIPSKKNSRIGIRVGNRNINIPSANYQKWHKQSKLKLIILHIGKKTIYHTDSVYIKFYMQDNRRRDLTNQAESIMDLLVDCGILSDDCWSVVPKLTLEFSGLSKENPRAEVEINER